jgi:ribosome-binding protein aMBF1 (putative translation factor)
VAGLVLVGAMGIYQQSPTNYGPSGKMLDTLEAAVYSTATNGKVVIMNVNKIGEVIRGLRIQKKLSQSDIEKRAGLLGGYVSRLENGQTIPSLEALSKIAGALEITLSQFFALTDKAA